MGVVAEGGGEANWLVPPKRSPAGIPGMPEAGSGPISVDGKLVMTGKVTLDWFVRPSGIEGLLVDSFSEPTSVLV